MSSLYFATLTSVFVGYVDPVRQKQAKNNIDSALRAFSATISSTEQQISQKQIY